MNSGAAICRPVARISRDETRELRNQDNDAVRGLKEARAHTRVDPRLPAAGPGGRGRTFTLTIPATRPYCRYGPLRYTH